MWQRFTERARRMVFFAQEESGRLGENYVSTEHLLLGLLRENDHVAARILLEMGVSLEAVRTDIERQVARAEGRLGTEVQLTPRSKRIIDLAYDEARMLNNNYIGTEHLLLGMVREAEGMAGRILSIHGVQLESVRRAVRIIQQQSTSASTMQSHPGIPVGTEGGTAEEPIAGDMGELHNPEERGGTEWVEVALTEEALEKMILILLLKDPYAYRELIESGAVLLVPTGTEAKLLWKAVQNPYRYFIRLFGSKHEGKAVWIHHDQFHRTGRDERPFPPPACG